MSTRIVHASCSLLVLSLAGCVTQVEERPSDVPVTVVDDTVDNGTSLDVDDVQEPPAPYIGGSDTDLPLPEEPTGIDCVDAEELCDSGAFACDDISEFCDIGPDGLWELPDEYDWDGP